MCALYALNRRTRYAFTADSRSNFTPAHSAWNHSDELCCRTLTLLSRRLPNSAERRRFEIRISSDSCSILYLHSSS